MAAADPSRPRHPRNTGGLLTGLAAGLGLAALLASTAAVQAAPDPGIMPVSEIRPGMKGHAVTVFSGGKSDRFDIEVLDVMPNYLPRQDAVLFTSPDPRMRHSGIVGGMSGSPVYINGKLVGAVAYGYRFNKDPIGGITPIQNMLDVAELPARPDVLPQLRQRGSRKGTRAWADAMLGLQTDPLPPRRRPGELQASAGLEPLGVPLSVSGLGPMATRALGEMFGMVPTRGGGGRSNAAQTPERNWKGGDSVSVVLIDGDNGVAPNGTVTWVSPKGDRLLAFGHPMFGDGPSNLPFAEARVHTIIPSVERSVKLSSAGAIRGAMIQDRQPAISLVRGLDAPMIPVTTTLKAPESEIPSRTYENRVALGVDLTPNLLRVLMTDAIDEAAPDAAEVVLKLRQEYDIETSKGARTINIEEEVFFPFGIPTQVLRTSRGLLAAVVMLDNDFEIPKIRQVRQNIEVVYDAPAETIENMALVSRELHAGDVARLELSLRTYKGELRKRVIPIRIPEDAAGEDILVTVTGGSAERPYRPMPDSVDDLIDTVEAGYPARSVIVSLYRGSEGLSTKNGLLPDLPASVIDTLDSRSRSVDGIRFKHLARRVIPSPTLINGKHTLKLSVRKRRAF